MGGNVSTCSVYTFRTSPYVSILKFDNTKEHYRVIRMYGGRKCINLQRIHISKDMLVNLHLIILKNTTELLGCMYGRKCINLQRIHIKEHYRVIRMYDGRKCINLQRIHISNKLYVSILKFDNTKEHYRVIRMYGWRKCINLQRIHISNKSIC